MITGPFFILGETYEIRDELKRLGCRWDGDAHLWCAPDEGARAMGQALADAEPLRIWRLYLDTLAWTPGAFTEVVWDAGLRGCTLGVPEEVACGEIAQRITGGGGDAKPGWVARNVGRAYQSANPPQRLGAVPAGHGAPHPPEPVKKVVYEESFLKRFAAPLLDVVDVGWLADRSPVNPLTCSTAEFLGALYGPGEQVVVLDVFRSQGQWLWSHEHGFRPTLIDYKKWAGNDAAHAGAPPEKGGRDFDGRGPQGIWYLTCPVNGGWVPTGEKDGHDRAKWSRRSEANITAWRYFTLESDIEGISREWIAAMVQLPLPIVAMYTSGGKSVHVLLRVDASSKVELDMWRQTALATIPKLGGDPCNMTSVRLSRLPGCWRLNDKEDRPYERAKFQRLLYLDPSPAASPHCVPICERQPLRDCVGPLVKMAEVMRGMDRAQVDEVDVAFLLSRLGQLAGVARAKAAAKAVRAWRLA